MKALNRWMYGPSPEEKVKEWDRRLKTEQRQLDREIRQVSMTSAAPHPRVAPDRCSPLSAQLDMGTAKARQSLKQLAAKNDVKSARLLAKEVVRTNKQKNRLHMSKARLGSIQMQMQHQLGEL